jgi:hypothetical protein
MLVDIEWSEDHVSAIGLCTLSCWRFLLRMLIWDQAELLGESGGMSVGKGGESEVGSRHLQCCSPCLCQLRTDGLVPMSKYWIYWSHARHMSPVNWCSLTSTGLCPHCFNGWSRRKTGWRPSFSGVVVLLNSVDDYVKGCSVWLVMSVYVSCVSGFSCRMYIDLNRRDSRI